MSETRTEALLRYASLEAPLQNWKQSFRLFRPKQSLGRRLKHYNENLFTNT